MAKKKKEHVTFDRVCKVKPSLPFAKTNRLTVMRTAKKSHRPQTETVSLRPMEDTFEDYIALRDWFHEPELCQWVWCDEKDEPPVTLDRVMEKYRPRVITPEDVFPYFILLDGNPIGFIQYYLHDECSIGIDMWIGSHDNRGKGWGTSALRQMVELIRKQHPDIREVFITPDPRNVRAVRCYEKAGFRTVGTMKDDEEECLLMKILLPH